MRLPRAALAKRGLTQAKSTQGGGAGTDAGGEPITPTDAGTAAHAGPSSGGPQPSGATFGEHGTTAPPSTASHPSLVSGQNPLDGAVDALLAHGEYVTKAHLDKLVRLLAVHGKEVRDLDADLDQPVDLRGEIQKQFRLLRQVQSAVTGSTDVEQIKKVLTASREIFQNLMKFQDTVHLQERSQAFENAVVEAMKELDNPDLLKKFRYLLAQKLSKTSKAAA